jgi:HSP20 family protein
VAQIGVIARDGRRGGAERRRRAAGPKASEDYRCPDPDELTAINAPAFGLGHAGADRGPVSGTNRRRRCVMLHEYSAAGRSLNPYQEMRRAQDEMNRLVSLLRLAPRIEFPPINVWANAESAVVTAEVPGVSPDQVDVAVYQDSVSLRGKRKFEGKEIDEAVLRRRERPQGAFARTIVLPFRVDPDQVSARLSGGVLTLQLPRPTADKPRKIQIDRS